MEDKGKNFAYALSITLGTIVLGLVSYIFYTSNVVPTKEAPRCEYNGWAYADKDIFPASDGCNTCYCDEGFVGCTEMDCTGSTENEIEIGTDKKSYKQGEEIRIWASNNTQDSVYYSISGPSFWSIEYMEGDSWVHPTYQEGAFYQIVADNMSYEIGDSCNFIVRMQELPAPLNSSESISYVWTQKVCAFAQENVDEGGAVKYLDSGTYRVSFTYGQLSNTSVSLVPTQTIYSDTFTVQ